ncbi:NUDIX domain-containing protein [Deinococcus sp. 6GRE01]|uniref:NUDIX domain-containing protein n=1 Tax=Deinococcus sp. 6GRE01 TaxID=2745873 RepID=UPI001E2E6968
MSAAFPPTSPGARVIRRWWRGLRPHRRMGAGVAVVRGESVLLVRRGDNALWDVPGGGADAGETPEDTGRRELREETGLSVGALRVLGVFPHRHAYPDGNVVAWETHVFTADFAGGEPCASDDAAEVRWWPLSALPGDVSEATGTYFAALTAVRA